MALRFHSTPLLSFPESIKKHLRIIWGVEKETQQVGGRARSINPSLSVFKGRGCATLSQCITPFLSAFTSAVDCLMFFSLSIHHVILRWQHPLPPHCMFPPFSASTRRPGPGPRIKLSYTSISVWRLVRWSNIH